MKIKFTKQEILDIIENIADKDYQHRAWFNVGPEVSSPDEVICTLYDDYFFEEFLDDFSSPINNQERETGKQFCAYLNKYLNEYDISDPYIVFNSKKWSEVREEAKKLIDIWS